ncbi:MAG: hypothetical protein U0Q16_15380 [Bryobacteraceae bacterium]
MNKSRAPIVIGIFAGLMALQAVTRSTALDCVRAVDAVLLIAGGFAIGAAIATAIATRRTTQP